MNDENPIPVKRRGIGTTLPVGWKHMSPPSEAVKNKIFQQIMERVKKEQLASAQRAARAEERKNEKEKSVWLKQQIEDCVRKIETVNSRKTELDDLKSRLFAQLKEVVAKDKAQKATLVSQQQQTNPAVAPTQSSSNKDKQDSSSAQSIELSPADDNNNNSNDSTANTTANNSQQMDDGHIKHNNNNLIYFYIDNTPFDGIKLSLMFMMYLFKCNKPRFASPSVKVS
ncbi:unnamed protein product [Anisakis simplex]|uniref:WW domain-containing protein n=1 Tax=Anisakis simplex TaxID=6269 RepID=A0A0M3JTS0_ANISI|nr:unnamed protein product [Anisakis simplex]